MKYKINNLTDRDELKHDTVSNHIDFLEKKFYQVETKWPQFRILFESLGNLAKTRESLFLWWVDIILSYLS